MKTPGKSFYSLEEYLTLSNTQIGNNPKRLSSVIRMHEGFDDWDRAQEKAKALRKNGDIDDYLNSIRAVEAEKVKSNTPAPAVTNSTSSQRPPSIYQKNYVRLMFVAPKLEEKLRNYDGEYIFGKAVKTGYLDCYLEVLRKEGNKFHIALSRHKKTESGNLVPAPDMEILVDIKKETVESLRYKDDLKDIEVYTTTKDRVFTDKKEKRSQNQYLGNWLKELRNHGQKIKWGGQRSPEIPSSFIVDEYKKGQPEEPTLKLVPPVEEPKHEGSKPKDSLEELQQARIIPLNAGYTENERIEMVEKFLRIVTLNEKTGFKEMALKALKIVNDTKTVPYLITAWNRMKESDYRHLTQLNYFRLNAIVPNLLETLKQEGGTIRLVSDQTKTAFRITLGDDRKENVVVLGIYQMNGKNPEPTLLVRIQTDSGAISTDLSTNRFAGLKDFNADEPSRFSEPLYESAIGFERWLKYITLKQFRPILVTMRKVEESPIIEFHQPEASEDLLPEEDHEFDNDYINKDIPDFEPGHVELTEAHKKRGVTQKVINYINKHKKGVVLFPRTKAMIHNTVDKVADLAHQAQMPGFRLSKTGKFYYEGRSNRADRTRSGY